MKTDTNYVRVVTYVSEVRPDVTSQHEHDADLIAWGDERPIAWKIVTENRSAAFGKKSEPSNRTTLDLLAKLRAALLEADEDSIWCWRAEFTLAHYADKKMVGGFFQQWDGKYDRGCVHLDYTPKTRGEVVERFVAWCGDTFETKAVKIDGEVVWTADVKKGAKR